MKKVVRAAQTMRINAVRIACINKAKTGLGLFAESEIPKGACVIEYTGVELTKEQEATAESALLKIYPQWLANRRDEEAE